MPSATLANDAQKSFYLLTAILFVAYLAIALMPADHPALCATPGWGLTIPTAGLARRRASSSHSPC